MGQGKATTIDLTININSERTKGILTMTDNGIGIANERRLLSWAAKDPTDNMHRNGHGLKKCLTKFHPDHATAKWEIKYRRRGKGLQVIKGPFLGTDTHVEEIESDETTLMPSGTSIELEFNLDRLGHNVTDQMILNNIREIIRTRYSNAKLSTVKINLEVGTINLEVGTIKASSHDTNTWKSFHETVKTSGIVEKLVDNHRVPIDGGHWTMDMYRINCDGRSVSLSALKNGFPHYGLKNMNCSRAHISSDGRMIEAMPLWKLLGKEANHNDLNGIFVFVDFVPTTPDDFKKMPTPCTTKVSFYESDEVFKAFVANAGPIIRRGMLAAPVVKAATKTTPAPITVVINPITVPVVAPKPVTQTPNPVVAPKPVTPTPNPVVIPKQVAASTPTPANSPVLTFRQTPADILVLENQAILYSIPYRSQYRTTEDYYKQTLDNIGNERFKRWAVEQVRANKMLN
jgi:hypothetical protein